jgi:predicted nucleic acid-binding protein
LHTTACTSCPLDAETQYATAYTVADIVIAATVRPHDLTILSPNARHFAPMDVVVIDPFQTFPAANEARKT